MWYFAWILGVLLACAFGIINVLWLEAQESLEQESVVLDPLTKTLIRFEFLSLLEETISHRQASQQPFSLLMIGLDPRAGSAIEGIKANADKTLLEYARIIRDELRYRSDVLARYDAATFAIMLPNTHAKGAESVSERICGNSESQLKSPVDSPLISIGIVECNPDLLSTVGGDTHLAVNTLLKRADNAMKQAQLQGKNSYVTAIGNDAEQI